MATWIGAVTGVGALLWNATLALNARRTRNRLRITAWMVQTGGGDLVTVEFLNAERHTGYRLTVSCRRPTGLQIRPAPVDLAEQLYGAANFQTQPVALPMIRDTTDHGVVRAKFVARGGSAKKPLVLSLTVNEANGRLCAKRRLPLSQG